MDEISATILSIIITTLIIATPIYMIVKKIKTKHMEKVILKEQYITAKKQKEERENKK